MSWHSNCISSFLPTLFYVMTLKMYFQFPDYFILCRDTQNVFPVSWLLYFMLWHSKFIPSLLIVYFISWHSKFATNLTIFPSVSCNSSSQPSPVTVYHEHKRVFAANLVFRDTQQITLLSYPIRATLVLNSSGYQVLCSLDRRRHFTN
jgi:predicted permease